MGERTHMNKIFGRSRYASATEGNMIKALDNFMCSRIVWFEKTWR